MRPRDGDCRVTKTPAQSMSNPQKYPIQSCNLREMAPLKHLSRPRPIEAMATEGHIPLKIRKAQCAFLVSIGSPTIVPQWSHEFAADSTDYAQVHPLIFRSFPLRVWAGLKARRVIMYGAMSLRETAVDGGYPTGILELFKMISKADARNHYHPRRSS